MTDQLSGPFGEAAALFFSEGVERALRTAVAAHAGQTRKGEPTPYVTHCFHVALIVAKAGGDDAALQAALLHDVVEDCEGWTVERVEALFGADVARTVADLTEEKGGSWEERKGAALDLVEHMGERSLLVKTADKLHNMRSLAARLAEASDAREAWSVFSRGPEPSLRYAHRLALRLQERLAETGRFQALGDDLLAAVEGMMGALPGSTDSP